MENCLVKEIIFENCRLKFGSMRIAMQSLHKNTSVRMLTFLNHFIHEKEASVISDMLK